MEKNQEGTTFLHLSPVFASADVKRDVEWYAKIGFVCVFDSLRYSEKLDFAVLGRQGFFIHLQYQFPADMTSTDVRIQVSNIVPLFEEYIKAQIVTEKAMRWKTAWGTKEFGFFDLSGNRIHFYEDL